MTDEELTALLKTDPKQGLAAVVGQYSAYVMKIARTRLGDVCAWEDMEEAVSDIFLIFYRKGRETGFEIRSVRAFLSVIAARHCTDIFRKKCRDGGTVPLEELAEEPHSDDFTDGYALAEYLQRLDPTDRQLIMRRYFFGQKSREIAAELHMKPNTVDKRISRALAVLRKMMEEDAQ